MDSDSYYLFKVIVIGDVNVGKTSLIKQFCESKFELNTKSTVGVDFQIQDIKVELDGRNFDVKLHIWDTAGEEKYKSLTSTFYRNADAAVIVFDLSREETFESVKYWIDSVRTFSGDIYKILVGNKCDLESNISDSDIEFLWYQHDLVYIETSAKSSTKVQEVFGQLAKDLVLQKTQLEFLPSLDNQGLDSLYLHLQEKEDSSQYCCYYF